MHDALTCLNKNFKDKVLFAKTQWAAQLCSKIHNMVMNLRIAWEHIRILMGSSTAHHKKSVTMAMKMIAGNVATNAKETCLSLDPI
jgi:hypothetical protein